MNRLDALADAIGTTVQRDVALGPLCTYKVGGAASVFVEASSTADLEAVRSALLHVYPDPDSQCPVLVIGKGSNLLVADRGVAGLVVTLGDAFAEIDIDEGRQQVRAGAAAFLPVVARRSAAASLTGFEWAVGVPGSIGGAVRMNAGGHGSDMAASLVRVSVFDLREGGPSERETAELELGYRHSNLASHQIVLFAELQLRSGERSESEAEISEIVRWRRKNQPGGQNAGSVFANPEGDSAGRIIDGLGLKGLRVGTASVSDKHANFIQADPAGSADDVFTLVRDVQQRVFDRTGIELRPENLLIGFDPDGGEHS